MPKSYPTYSNLSDYFAQVGIALPSQAFCEDLLEGIQEEVEDYLGYNFFNTAAASTTQYYNYPSNTGILQSREIYNSVSSVTLNGTAQVLNTDYWFNDQRQFTFNLGSGYFPEPNSLTITGVVGFTTNIPTHVWRGILDYASYKIVFNNPSRVFTKLVQGDVDLSFGDPINTPDKFWEIIEGYRY
jgi:hypothetical protein